MPAGRGTGGGWMPTRLSLEATPRCVRRRHVTVALWWKNVVESSEKAWKNVGNMCEKAWKNVEFVVFLWR